MRTLCAFLFVLLTTLVQGLPLPVVMPLDDVRPGMRGYGLTVLEGSEPQRFEFEVIGFQKDWNTIPKVIMVRVFGGPKDRQGRRILDEAHIIAGMSGSPLYLNGQLMGALAFGPDFQTTTKGFVTPIQYMLNMRPEMLGTPRPGAPTLHPGEYFKFCMVWGDADDCGSATVTAQDATGMVYGTGHPLPVFPIGSTTLPVWRTQVMDILSTQRSSSKMTGETIGEVIGTLGYNGQFGNVIVPGVVPPSFDVRLEIQIKRETGIPLVRNYHATYQTQVADLIASHIAANVDGVIESSEVPTTEVEATIRVAGIDQPIRIVDQLQRGLSSFSSLLEALIGQLHPAGGDPIQGVDVVIRINHDRPMHVVRSLKLHPGTDNNVALSIVARRETDTRLVQTAQNIGPFGPGVWDKKLVWLDGGNVQELLMNEHNIADVISVLQQISDRRRLYLIAPREYVSAVNQRLVPGSWSDVSVVATIYQEVGTDMPLAIQNDAVFTMMFEKNPENGTATITMKRSTLSAALE